MYTHGKLLSFSSVAMGDVLWKRALGSLPAPLAGALRDAGVDDASTLVHYPRWSKEQFEEYLRGSGGSSLRRAAGASSDATSSRTSTCTYGHGVHPQGVEWIKGVDPKTDHEAFLTGGDPRTNHASSGITGGDPKTDHASFGSGTLFGGGMAATCPPYRPERLATETATSSASASPAVLATVDHALPDGFPSESSVRPDGLPCLADFLSVNQILKVPQSSIASCNGDSVLVFYGIFALSRVRKVSASRSSSEVKTCPPVRFHPS